MIRDASFLLEFRLIINVDTVFERGPVFPYVKKRKSMTEEDKKQKQEKSILFCMSLKEYGNWLLIDSGRCLFEVTMCRRSIHFRFHSHLLSNSLYIDGTGSVM